jgi:hypothetical protein
LRDRCRRGRILPVPKTKTVKVKVVAADEPSATTIELGKPNKTHGTVRVEGDRDPKRHGGIEVTIRQGGQKDRKFSRPKLDEICGYLTEGLNITDSCTIAGISRETYYQWKKRPGVADAFKKAELACKREKIKVIRKASTNNWTAAAWWLERKYRDEFAVKSIQQHEGTVTVGYGDLEGKPKPKSVEEAREVAHKSDGWGDE